jgi:hypothetical protein
VFPERSSTAINDHNQRTLVTWSIATARMHRTALALLFPLVMLPGNRNIDQ